MQCHTGHQVVSKACHTGHTGISATPIIIVLAAYSEHWHTSSAASPTPESEWLEVHIRFIGRQWQQESGLRMTVVRPGQVLKLSRGGPARHNYAHSHALIDPVDPRSLIIKGKPPSVTGQESLTYESCARTPRGVPIIGARSPRLELDRSG